MNFTEECIDNLRAKIKAELSEKRYVHTLGVEKMARHIGSVLMPDKIPQLAVAALLHDIAKELPYEEQAELVKIAGIAYTQEDIMTKPTLHSIAAVSILKRDFAEFATDDVCSAVANHTFGAPEMSIFDEIIFISDYAEEGRTYPSCIEVHKFIMANVKITNSMSDNLCALHRASLRSIEETIRSLSSRKESINSRTLKTQRYLDRIISK